jgi:hypothetical protein
MTFKHEMKLLERELEELNNQCRQPEEDEIEDVLRRKSVLLGKLQSKINQTIKNKKKNNNKNKKKTCHFHRKHVTFIDRSRKLLGIILDDNIKDAHREYENKKANAERLFQLEIDQLLQNRDESIRQYKEKYENDDYGLYEQSMSKIVNMK